MFKRIAAIALAFAFIAAALAPDALGCNRRRSRASGYAYNQSRSGYAYSPYRYRGVASDRYYNEGRRGGIGSTGRAILTVGAPAAIGAGIGALMGGKKGAAVGALLGGGGGAAYYLIKKRGRRY
jgi:hypothetical protein